MAGHYRRRSPAFALPLRQRCRFRTRPRSCDHGTREGDPQQDRVQTLHEPPCLARRRQRALLPTQCTRDSVYFSPPASAAAGASGSELEQGEVAKWPARETRTETGYRLFTQNSSRSVCLFPCLCRLPRVLTGINRRPDADRPMPLRNAPREAPPMTATAEEGDLATPAKPRSGWDGRQARPPQPLGAVGTTSMEAELPGSHSVSAGTHHAAGSGTGPTGTWPLAEQRLPSGSPVTAQVAYKPRPSGGENSPRPSTE